MTAQNSDLTNLSLLELFNMEVETQSANLVENLLALETLLQSSSATTLGQIKPLLESLMRASHSIKGAAKVVQIDAESV